MRLRKLNLNLLLALDALLETRNVSLAAERLHLSQSAMSGALARLRDYFEDPLLVRSGRELVLTPRGESLMQPIRNLLIQMEAALESRPDFDPRTAQRTFTVISSDYMTTVLLPRIVKRLERVAPGVRLEIQAITEDAAMLLERGNANLLVSLEPTVAPDHPRELLFEETHCCVVWEGNREIGATLTLDAYLAAGHVGVQLGRARRSSADEIFLGAAGIKRHVEIVAPGFSAVPFLIVGSHRIGTVQTRLAQIYAGLLPLRLFPLPLPMPPVREVVQWHKYSAEDPGIMWLQQLFRQVSSELPGSPLLSSPDQPPAATPQPI